MQSLQERKRGSNYVRKSDPKRQGDAKPREKMREKKREIL